MNETKTLADRHPNWRNVVRSPAYCYWLSTQSVTAQRAAEKDGGLANALDQFWAAGGMNFLYQKSDAREPRGYLNRKLLLTNKEDV